MRNYTIIFIVLLLLMSPSTSFAQSEDQEAGDEIIQSDRLVFPFNNMIGSDGGDSVSLSSVDKDGNLIVIFEVHYPIYNPNSFSLYAGPFYNRDPNFKEFPISDDAFDSSYNYGGDIVITKYDQNGNLIYSTYFGGSSSEKPSDVVIDDDNNIIIVGSTSSEDFPLLNPIKNETKGASDGFISVFSPDGNLTRSTYFGGDQVDKINKIEIDTSGNMIFTGLTKSENYPLVNAVVDLEDVEIGRSTPISYVTKLDSNWEIVFSTFLGGSDIDNDFTFTVLDNDEIVTIGLTKSEDFYVTPDAPNRKHNGLTDAFYTRFSPTGEIEFSTFIGGILIDWVADSVVDNNGNIIITGYTNSENFPTEDGEDRELNNGDSLSSDVILAKLDDRGQMIWSTYFGGTLAEIGHNIFVDESNHIVVTGTSNSINYPVWGITENLDLNNGVEYDQGDPTTDIFVAKFVSDGRLAWSVIFGSDGTDYFGTSYLVSSDQLLFGGSTNAKNSYPSTNDYQPSALNDAFVGTIEIPDVVLPPKDQYTGYRGELFQELSVTPIDLFGYLVIAIIAINIIIFGVRRTNLLDKFRKTDDVDNEDKAKLKQYLNDMKKI